MTSPATRLGTGNARMQVRPGPLPLVAAAATVAAVLVWLLVRDPHGSIRPGFAAGPIAMAAAFFACHRIGRAVVVARPVRAFWRLYSHSAICVGIGAAVSFGLSNNRPGISPYVAVPLLLGVALLMLAFMQLPRQKRSALRWAQLMLDGATVAVAGALFFWYVVLQLAPPGLGAFTQYGAAIVGVGGLVALVVIGRAAMSPASVVDPMALRILAVPPFTGVVVSVLLIVGGETGRLWLSVLSVPAIGAAMALAAYRQQVVLARPGGAPTGPPRRSFTNVLPIAAVVATTALVITMSARQLNSGQRVVIVGAVLIAAFVVARQLLGRRAGDLILEGVRRQQAELEHLAMHDSLTGLANRARFQAALAERLTAHRDASVLMIDIDDFKTVNDTMGHATGDQLLCEVAQRLRQGSAETHLPARLGADEFAVLLDTEDPEAAEEIAAGVLAALTVPFRVGEHQLLAHASIGVALAGQGDSAEEVLRNADIALHEAKAAGKASWARFEPRMRQEVVNLARLGSELHNAIIRHELYLMYQPVFDIVTGRMAGAEALVRWNHPTRGNVPPSEFVPVAERSGLILPLGGWVLREACRQLAAWQAAHGTAAISSINVNVAARQLRDPGFVDEVAAVLGETGLLPANLVLEVTESSVLDGRQVRGTLEALHALGVKLALDDFGTGQSSLSLLRAFPVDVLKLDKSFVDGICDGEDRGRLAVAAAVAQLADNLDLYAVAEGIESADQLDRLRQMGYRLGQGYHMAKPLPPGEMAALMLGTATTSVTV
ncbi:putative bifunctional diguanylate cyclase/phosphodiesterase [Actinoplanes sp. NPDC051859]|uniref:putative bifunctional diguanylate cyclase/phosphodiesterase n=1 Tax=Actinoplanes sp. NPDC051859 TaxID=3363909 RepID=UPI0037B2EB60